MGKKKDVQTAAVQLFSKQGFDGTTTIQIAREAGVTEPLIYYHLKGKDELFTQIIAATFSKYFSLINNLEKNPGSPFEQIQKLIELQYEIAEEMPDEVQLIANTSRPSSMIRSISVPETSKNTTASCLDI